MKRYALSCIALIGTVGLLAGCSGDTGSGQSDGKTSLTFSMWAGSDAENEALDALVAIVEEEHPDITLKLETAPFNDYWTKLAAQASGGAEACILGVQAPRTRGIEGLLLPLEPDTLSAAGIDMSDFDSAISEAMQVDGTQMAVPYDLGPLIVFYNEEMFAEAGVDVPSDGWTVDDFESAAAALSGDGKYGYAANPILDSATAWSLTLAGTQGVMADGQLDLTNDGMVQAIEFMQSLVADGSSPDLPATSDSYNALNSFVSGDAAMVIDGPWQLAYVGEQVPFSFGVATIPAGDAGTSTPVSGSGYGVSASCQYPEEAALAVASLTGPEAQKTLAEMGRAYPARVAEQPAYFEGDFGIAEETLTAAGESGEPLRSTSNFTQVNTLFNQYAVSALNGDMSAEDFLDTVQSQTAAGAQ
jgi:multiple sugar transport system substrate-binding protein